MEAKLKCRIVSAEDYLSEDNEKLVKLIVRSVEGSSYLSNGVKLNCQFEGKLLVKPLVVESLPFGAVIEVNMQSK